jgi:UDP-N-acetylglucosamine 2-epimerase (non-hydrolysing)
MLGGDKRIPLAAPLDYPELVATMMNTHSTLSYLANPVLVMRQLTELLIDLGVARLVGVDEEKIVSEASQLLSDDERYARIARGGSLYGDGRVSARICDAFFV